MYGPKGHIQKLKADLMVNMLTTQPPQTPQSLRNNQFWHHVIFKHDEPHEIISTRPYMVWSYVITQSVPDKTAEF